MVDAAAVAANFEMMTRLADGTGAAMPAERLERSAQAIEIMGIAELHEPPLTGAPARRSGGRGAGVRPADGPWRPRRAPGLPGRRCGSPVMTTP